MLFFFSKIDTHIKTSIAFIVVIVMADVLVSGGATGADCVFGTAAIKAGLRVIHFTVSGKNEKKHDGQEYICLHEDVLEAATPQLRIAAKHLGKHMPRPGYGKRLIQRNFYQIWKADSVYAIGWKTQDSSLLQVEGGTGWTCQLYVQRFQPLGSEPAQDCHLYLYEMATASWWQWDCITSKWNALFTGPPRPTGVCAGIGSRSMNPEGTTAIQALFA